MLHFLQIAISFPTNSSCISFAICVNWNTSYTMSEGIVINFRLLHNEITCSFSLQISIYYTYRLPYIICTKSAFQFIRFVSLCAGQRSNTFSIREFLPDWPRDACMLIGKLMCSMCARFKANLRRHGGRRYTRIYIGYSDTRLVGTHTPTGHSFGARFLLIKNVQTFSQQFRF